MGSNSCSSRIILNTNLKLQTCVSHEQKQLQTLNKVNWKLTDCSFVLCDNPKIKVLLQVGPFLKSYHICIHAHCSAFLCNITGSSNFCLSCGHGGHARHMLEWFTKYGVCPSVCGCRCLESNGSTSTTDNKPKDTSKTCLWKNVL